jgi:hypothetical protein
MARLILGSILVLAAIAPAQVVEFYGGDGDGRAALSNELGGRVTDGWVFDDFNHDGRRIVGLWGNVVPSADFGRPFEARYEIRRGVSEGNGGDLMASGAFEIATWIETGRTNRGLPEHQYKGSVAITLPAGTYYLAVVPVAPVQGQGRAFLQTTSAQDLGPSGDPNPSPAGSPLKNGNSYFRSEYFKANYEPTWHYQGAGTWDFSLGVEVTPEPLCLFALALGAAFARRR